MLINLHEAQLVESKPSSDILFVHSLECVHR